jgi:hypothetical protein
MVTARLALALVREDLEGCEIQVLHDGVCPRFHLAAEGRNLCSIGLALESVKSANFAS